MADMQRRSILAIAGVMGAAGFAGRPARASDQVTVFAAASLTDVMRDVDAAWQRAGHAGLRQSFAASSTLARQIEQGAPADIFISADEQWMDELEQRDLLRPNTRQDLLHNKLVLVMPKDSAHPVEIAPGFALADLLGSSGRLAVGDPAHVPAGIYAKQALTRLGIWPSVADRLAISDSVRSALLLVERGEAPAGIVYATDAASAPGVTVVGTFPADSHPPITYPVALTRAAQGSEPAALLAFLKTPEAAGLFRARGFSYG